MKELDEYGKGRLSVISECIIFCDTEISKYRTAKNETDSTHFKASISGQVKALVKVRQKMKTKLRKLKING